MSIPSASYESLLMLFEHLQLDFAFIIEQVKPLPRMILLNISLFPPQNLGTLTYCLSLFQKLGN